MRWKKQKKNKIFCVYIDYTNEKVPRPFYVGKGTKQRVGIKKRNLHWESIVKLYGFNRIVYMENLEEAEAFRIEKEQILKHKTYRDYFPPGVGWGANHSLGGEGPSGMIHTEEARRQMVLKRTGMKRSEETCKILSECKMGEKNPMFGTKHTEERKAKIAKSVSENNYVFFEKGRVGARGENAGRSKYTEQSVREIKYLLQTTDWSCEVIGNIVNIPRQTVSHIKFERIWTHVPWFFPIIRNA